jgi:cytochrome P450
MIPGFLQPLLAPLITLPNRYHTRQIRSLLRPEIERRLALYDAGKEAPNDFLQWFVTYARDNLEAEESTPKFVADRIATINFAAIHTSTFSIVNTILDIVTSPDKDSLLQMIKAEIEDVLADDNGEWTKTSVQRLVKTDSMLRESMRYSTFMTGAIQRCVLAKEGVTTPDGLHLKYGTMVEVPGWPKHLDVNISPDADKFLPLRFVESSPSQDGAKETSKTIGGLSVVDTSHDFLNFSHGRHACPGRFFAANELKLLLAYIALHYEVEPLMMEPKAIAFGSVMTPNPKLSVRIKRKASS